MFQLYTFPVNYADPFQKQPKMNVTTRLLKSNLHSLHFTESSPSQKKLPLNDDQLKESAKSSHCMFNCRQLSSIIWKFSLPRVWKLRVVKTNLKISRRRDHDIFRYYVLFIDGSLKHKGNFLQIRKFSNFRKGNHWTEIFPNSRMEGPTKRKFLVRNFPKIRYISRFLSLFSGNFAKKKTCSIRHWKFPDILM